MNMVLGVLVTLLFEMPEVKDGAFDFNFFHNYINRSLEIIAFLIWIWLLWRGSKDEVFFSTRNAINLLISGTLVLSAHIFGVVQLLNSD